MYSYLFFGSSLLGIFSIVENIKGEQKMSFLKWNIVLLLIFMTISASFSFLDEIGYQIGVFPTLNRLFFTITLVNLFYIIAHNSVPKLVIYFECFFIITYVIMTLNGFEFLNVKQGVFSTNVNQLHKFNIYVTNTLIFSSLIYNLFTIYKKTDRGNLYQLKILNWSFFIVPIFATFFILGFLNIWLFKNPSNFIKSDTRMIFIFIYPVLLFFILLRPKFVDEADFSLSKKYLLSPKSPISLKDFNFLFYFNHYYLNPKVHLEDFALKLNRTEGEVTEFIKLQTTDSFSELLSRNRIKYFKELLNAKKFESFTIEALSEMSGFNNRRTMYNAFKKYEGGSPSEYITTLK